MLNEFELKWIDERVKLAKMCLSLFPKSIKLRVRTVLSRDLILQLKRRLSLPCFSIKYDNTIIDIYRYT